MVIITLETETPYNIRTTSRMVEDFDWKHMMGTMKEDPSIKYSIRVLVRS
jgi:hypothetical protein